MAKKYKPVTLAKGDRTWETTSAVEETNLRQRGWTDAPPAGVPAEEPAAAEKTAAKTTTRK